MRTSWTSSLPHQPLGQWACDQGFKKGIAISADYAFGYETAGGFQKAFEDCGGKVIQKIWPPLGTKDFGPYIPTMKADADVIFTTMVGPMALQFPKQLRAAGNKKPIVASGVSYDEFVLPFMGDEVIGDVSALHYSAAIDTPRNQAFVKAYRAKFGKVPCYYSENNYTTAMWLDEAIKKAGGKYPGPEEFIKIMASIKLDAPRGPGRTRRNAQSDRERLHQESREEEDVRLRQGRALEHGDQDLSQGQPVLDLRQGEIPCPAGLRPRISRPANTANEQDKRRGPQRGPGAFTEVVRIAREY